MTTKDITNLITEFTGTTFHENYRATDWLLAKLMVIEDDHRLELKSLTEEIKRIINKRFYPVINRLR